MIRQATTVPLHNLEIMSPNKAPAFGARSTLGIFGYLFDNALL